MFGKLVYAEREKVFSWRALKPGWLFSKRVGCQHVHNALCVCVRPQTHIHNLSLSLLTSGWGRNLSRSFGYVWKTGIRRTGESLQLESFKTRLAFFKACRVSTCSSSTSSSSGNRWVSRAVVLGDWSRRCAAASYRLW